MCVADNSNNCFNGNSLLNHQPKTFPKKMRKYRDLSQHLMLNVQWAICTVQLTANTHLVVTFSEPTLSKQNILRCWIG